jgi:glucokinase
LRYDNHFDAFIPIASEGGHADLPIYNDFEFKLVNYIKNLRGISQPITYEEVLSGRGLEAIYLFLRNITKTPDNKYTTEIDNSNNIAALISKYKDIDETCKETFRIFTRFYGRCAKNYALDTLAMGGLYIAGGIAAKNHEIFNSKEFLEEFENGYRREDILKKISIFVVVNYDVSLYGACFAAMLQSKK